MNQQFEDETLLARWLSGALSEAERAALEQHPDFPAFKRLVDAADRLALPDPDVQGMWDRFSQNIATQRKPKVALRRTIISWVAAAAVLTGSILVALPFLQSAKEAPMLVQTAAGEQKTVTLPDGSTARLNAVSTIEIYKEGWSQKRRVHLDGEALFNVQKNPAAPFSVETERGSVEVLGTVFTVKSRSTVFEVNCYAGKVRAVNSDQQTQILTAGQGAAVHFGARTWSDLSPAQDTIPPWTDGNSRFDNAALPEVLTEVENQYGVKIDAKGLENRRFSGAFPHNNLDLSLKIICGALDLTYTVTGKKVVVRGK